MKMVTIKQVAETANVSKSTVSRALNNKSYVDEKTKARIMDAVKELNYQPNIFAKTLKEGKTNTIALIVPSIQNQVFPAIARGVEDAARKMGYVVFLCNSDEDEKMELEYIKKLRMRQIDGFIFASAVSTSQHILDLKEMGYPVVLVIRDMGNKVDSVIIDNKEAAFKAVSYLIKTGHKKIAIAVGNRNISIYGKRFEGYREALQKYGMEYDEKLLIHDGNDTKKCYSLTQRMLNHGIIPDAIFATSDPKAIQIMKAIKDFGLKIPNDISVVGIDNLEISNLLDPPLTTVSQPLYDMGVMAASRLIELINQPAHDEPIVEVMSTDLIIRGSTR